MKLNLLVFILLSQTILAQNFVLSGTISNFTNKQPVPYATVSVKKLIKRLVNGNYDYQRIDYKQLVTDSLGRFNIPLEKSEFVIEASAIGFQKKSKFINIKADASFELELNEALNQLDDLEVKARKAESNVTEVSSGVIKLNIQSLKKLPVVFGEPDLIKALTLQPGVSVVGEGAGGFNVRGGRVDQNLVLLDDAPLYNTSHLLGFFTNINTEVIQNATLYKAGIPAAYGGRLSSLFSIQTKSQIDSAKKSIGIGIISSNALFQQSFLNGKLSVLLGGRLAYPNWLIKQFPKRFKGSSAGFYDLNTAIQYKINPRQIIKISAYNTADNFKFPEDTSYFWQSKTATFQYSFVPNAAWSFQFKGIHSAYSYGVNGLRKDFEYKFSSDIIDQAIKIGAYYTATKVNFDFGLSQNFYKFNPGSRVPKGPTSNVNAFGLDSENALESAAHVSFDYVPTKKFSVQMGLRAVRYSRIGASKQFIYKANEPLLEENITDSVFFKKGQKIITYPSLEPRLSARYQISKQVSIKATYHRMRQFVHLITNTTAISPIDFWKLSDAFLPPQTADQFSLGYFRNFNENKIQTYLEVFYKPFKNLVEYKDGADLVLNPHLETELLPANGFAYGTELNTIFNFKRFSGNLSYTWSRSWVNTVSTFTEEQVNQGVRFPSLFDKPHILSLNSEYYLGSGYTLSGSFTYQTGRPLTLPESQYVLLNTSILNYNNRNLNRLPDFHRLDLALSKDSRRNKDQKRYFTTNFSVYNAYARKNPYSIFYRQFLSTSKAYRLAVLGTMVPSLTINYHW